MRCRPMSMKAYCQTEVEDEGEAAPSPFSQALTSVRARAANSEQRKAQGRRLWEPSRNESFVDLTEERPSDYDCALEVVCKYIHQVRLDGFGVLAEDTRTKLCTRLCALRKMTGRLMALLVSGQQLTELVLPHCSDIEETDFYRAFQSMSTEKLRVLKLGGCARALSDHFVECVKQTQGFPALQTLSLESVYRMSDGSLIELAQSCKELTCLELRQFHSITEIGVKRVLQLVGSKLESLSLEGCAQLNPGNLVLSCAKMPNLRRLTLSHIKGVTDKVLQVVLACWGVNLTELELDSCDELTDEAVRAIVIMCPGLKVLNLDNLNRLTDASMEAMVNRKVSFEKLSLERCNFSDEALACLVTSLGGNLKQLSLQGIGQAGDQTLQALATHCGGSLEELDISWCLSMADEYLGFLADSCHKLTKLTLQECTQVTHVFTNGHSNSRLRLVQ